MAYKYIAEAWAKPEKSFVDKLARERQIKWRRQSTITRIDKPTRIDRARKLGYKANRETLEILYKSKSIADALGMTVDDALELFKDIPRIRRKLESLHDVGLGYIRLGQQATSLSGGEAQRVTSVSTGARLPKFSPDGTRIAFTSDVHRDSRSDADSRRIAEEEKARKYNVRTYTGFPIRNWDKWLPDRQPRVIVQTIGRNDARDLLAGSELVKQRGYAGSSTAGGSELDVVWAPDA